MGTRPHDASMTQRVLSWLTNEQLHQLARHISGSTSSPRGLDLDLAWLLISELEQREELRRRIETSSAGAGAGVDDEVPF